MLEKDFQKIVEQRILTEFAHYERNAKIYTYGRGLKPIGHKRRHDLALFHDLTILPNPIGIELKTDRGFQQITKGLYDQVRGLYATLEFEVPAENFKGRFPFWCFATEPGIIDGILYDKHHADASNFFIERFAWRFGVAILKRAQENERLEISWKNARYSFNDRYTQIYKADD